MAKFVQLALDEAVNAALLRRAQANGRSRTQEAIQIILAALGEIHPATQPATREALEGSMPSKA